MVVGVCWSTILLDHGGDKGLERWSIYRHRRFTVPNQFFNKTFADKNDPFPHRLQPCGHDRWGERPSRPADSVLKVLDDSIVHKEHAIIRPSRIHRDHSARWKTWPKSRSVQPCALTDHPCLKSITKTSQTKVIVMASSDFGLFT